jgi:hypothetical protein
MAPMKLTKPQVELLRTLSDGRSHEVREHAVGFSGYVTSRGARVTTIAALKDAGLITTEKVRGSDTYRGYTRYGHTEYAELTPAGHAYLAGLRAR